MTAAVDRKELDRLVLECARRMREESGVELWGIILNDAVLEGYEAGKIKMPRPEGFALASEIPTVAGYPAIGLAAVDARYVAAMDREGFEELREALETAGAL